MNVSKLEFSTIIIVEMKISLDLSINKFLIPHFHFYNSPIAINSDFIH